MVYRTTYSKAGTAERMKADRFKMEERILRMSSTSDDIEDFLNEYYEGETRMTEDQVFNVLWGIKELNDIRCSQLFDVFKRVFKLDEYAPDDIKELRESIFNKSTNESDCND